MFLFALLLGIYSYSIFFLGLLGLLYRLILLIFTVVFIGFAFFITRKSFFESLRKLKEIRLQNTLLLLCVGLFLLQLLVNFIGALGPGLAFDELWYHVTLPKLWLLHHQIFFIPGGLLYYSAMPKLAELLYAAGLSFGNEIVPQLIHFIFGLLICLVIYKMAQRFLTPFSAFLAVVIFYSNIVVDWESTIAYIDLVRTFFEVMALWGFLLWWEQGRWKWLLLSSLMIGFSIMTKLLAIGSLVIFTILIIIKYLSSRASKESREIFLNKTTKWYEIPRLRSASLGMTKALFVYNSIALAISLPWFIFSYIHTGNPLYPFFTPLYPVNPSHFSIIGFFGDIWNLFIHADDPVSPVYLIFLPLIIMFFWKGNIGKKSEIKLLGIYSILALIVWYFTPRTGGGRFIVPYLPAFSILCAAIYSEILKNTRIKSLLLSRLLLCVVIFIAIISLAYRGAATIKYLPVVFGKESQDEFLTKHLNFSFGDFYDTDNYFKTHIKSSDVVLLYGFHNLYYVDFPFIDNSWLKKGDKFDYIAVQNAKLPARFKNWQLVYKNDRTLIQLYKPPAGACSHLCDY